MQSERVWIDESGERWRISMEFAGAREDDDRPAFVLSWVRETGAGDQVVTPASPTYELSELSDSDLRAFLRFAMP